MRNIDLNTFPLYSDRFPMVWQSRLISNASKEAENITQTQPGMAYLATLGAASIALQGGTNVEMPYGNIIPISIYSLIFADSGARKTALLKLLLKGVKAFQKKVIKKHIKEVEKYNIKLSLYHKKKRLIEKSFDLNDESQLAEMLDELVAHQKLKPIEPKLPLVSIEDSTIEALHSNLSEHIPNAYLGSSEGGIVLNSRLMSATASLNSFWSGDDVNINRKSGGSHTLEEVRLTIIILTQWSALGRFFKKSTDDIRGNGFLSRTIISAENSNCGFRQSSGGNHSQDGLNAFSERICQLLSETADMEDYASKKVVKFSEDAKRIWFAVYNDIELKMRPNGIFYNAKDHASKVLENAARIAAITHCFDNSPDTEIPKETLIEAINVVSFYSGHFMKVFCAPPKYITDAENLKQWLIGFVNSGVRYIKRNDLLQRGPIGARKKKEFEPAYDHLKSILPFVEFKWGGTRVVDLKPHELHDEYKLNKDMTLFITYCEFTEV